MYFGQQRFGGTELEYTPFKRVKMKMRESLRNNQQAIERISRDSQRNSNRLDENKEIKKKKKPENKKIKKEMKNKMRANTLRFERAD